MEYKTPRQPEQPPMEIAPEILSEEALRGIIENFILREGTDYGQAEASFAAKSSQILKQIKNKQVKIVFDPNSETVGILTQAEFQKHQRTQTMRADDLES